MTISNNKFRILGAAVALLAVACGSDSSKGEKTDGSVVGPEVDAGHVEDDAGPVSKPDGGAADGGTGGDCVSGELTSTSSQTDFLNHCTTATSSPNRPLKVAASKLNADGTVKGL